VPGPLKLPDMDEVEKHFRSVHKEAIVKPVDSHTLSGVAARGMRCQGLSRLARKSVEDQRRFPLQIATVLSQQFGSRNLQFFKVNKTLTHVSVARPHYLDMEMTPVSDGIKRIVDFINSQSKCTRRKLVEALAPAPQPAQPAPAAAAQGPEGSPSPAPTPEPTPEQTAVIADLHWLIHQGHVIEFANGFIETAKRPVPKPPKPETKAPKPAAEPPAAIGGTETVAVNNAATPAAEAEEMPSSEPAASDSAKALEGPVSETASEEAPPSSAAPVETDEQRVLQPEAESPAQSEKPSEADADESADKPASQPPAP
jgi:hypothetical protein